MLIPISTDHAETRRSPTANLLIVGLTCVVSLALMGRLDDALLTALATRGDPLLLTGGFAHLPLLRGHSSPLQLIGHTFLHADVWHLLGNMLVLLALGNPVNARLGHARYLALYAVSAVAGGLGWLLCGDGGLVIGASGAVSGVTAAFLVLFPLTRVHTLLCVSGLSLAALALGWRATGMTPGPELIGAALAVVVTLTIVSLRSVAERTPPEGVFLRVLGFWSFPIAGLWITLFFVGLDVVAVALDLGGNVAHEAHLGGAAAGLAVALVLAGLGVVRGTREDPTLLELVGLKEPAPSPARPSWPSLAHPRGGLALPATRRYERKPTLAFSDYARLRRLEASS